MFILGDGTTILIGISTLIIAALNFLKLREPFVTLNAKPKIVMSAGLPRGLDTGTIILSYRNATTNNMVNNFSIKGTICCENKEIDISNLLPSNVHLAPAQTPPEIQIDVQRIIGENKIILGAPYFHVYLKFDCSHSRFKIKREQHFRYKWDLTLPVENQWTIY